MYLKEFFGFADDDAKLRPLVGDGNDYFQGQLFHLCFAFASTYDPVFQATS